MHDMLDINTGVQHNNTHTDNRRDSKRCDRCLNRGGKKLTSLQILILEFCLGSGNDVTYTNRLIHYSVTI